MVNFNEVTDRAVSDLSDLATYKRVKVFTHFEALLIKEVNPELTSVFISNIVKNAIVHNVENGTVRITIKASSMMVENTGDSMPLDSVQIFKRFYKGSTSNLSTGLGLSIVKSIADYYGWTVEYNFTTQHQFVVTMNTSSVSR